MNRAHRLADQFRSVVGWLGRVPSDSQFVTKGFLTPAEFVEAGDQLVFQCPTWQWQACANKKNQVFWLPPSKQYLLTRNIPCRYRIADWEESLHKRSHLTQDGWLVPGPQPEDERQLERRHVDQTLQTADGSHLSIRHGEDSSSDSEDLESPGGTPELKWGPNRTPGSTTSVTDGDYCILGPTKQPLDDKTSTVPTRSYDLSITYDKYYQSPRLWLFGYDESGIPLRAEAVFEDIHSDYLSKTVTVDPHPFTGVPTVSIHPCKHASVLKMVAQNWVKSGIQPRHDLALFLLLKMVASVVPTINYDFTIDIEMPIGLSLPSQGDEPVQKPDC